MVIITNEIPRIPTPAQNRIPLEDLANRIQEVPRAIDSEESSVRAANTELQIATGAVLQVLRGSK